MQLSRQEAQNCATLLRDLDFFALKATHPANKPVVVDEDDPHFGQKMHLKLRSKWISQPYLIDLFIMNNKNLSHEEIAILKGWKNRQMRRYLVVKYYHDYATFYIPEEDRCYGVLALNSRFEEMLPDSLPIWVETMLLPYKGQIVWDGLVKMGLMPMDDALMEGLINTSDYRREWGQVITQL